MNTYFSDSDGLSIQASAIRKNSTSNIKANISNDRDALESEENPPNIIHNNFHTAELKNSKILITTELLSKSYKGESGLVVSVFQDININVHEGELLAIVGRSGSGKTTLISILSGLEQPTTGKVLFENQNIHQISESEKEIVRNNKIGFVYQSHHLMNEFSAIENVMMPLLIRGESKKTAWKKAFDILSTVNMEKRIHHKPRALSGGQCQRTAIARALVTNPKCVFLDEPTGNLDEDNARKLQGLILELQKEQKTSFVVVTHDMQWALQMNRIIEFQNRGIVESLTSEYQIPKRKT